MGPRKEELGEVGRKGWRRVRERLAKSWQRAGEGLAKGWQRVGGFPCTLQLCNSRNARLEDRVYDSMVKMLRVVDLLRVVNLQSHGDLLSRRTLCGHHFPWFYVVNTAAQSLTISSIVVVFLA